MEPEVSSPHSQVLTTSPYPEPDQSCPFPTSHFLKIRLNIILPSMPGSYKCSLSHKFRHQNPVYTFLLPHTCYMHRLTRSSEFDQTKKKWVMYRSLSSSLCSFLYSPVTSSLSNISRLWKLNS